MLIDTHAHLNFAEYKGQVEDVLKRSFDVGVKKVVNIGSNYETSKEAIKIVKTLQHSAEYERVYAVVGCHPIHLMSDITETAKFDGKEYKFTTKKEEFDSDKYQKLIDSSDKVVGIGETGLDYFRLNDKTQISNVKSSPNEKMSNKRSLDKLEMTKKTQKKVFIKHIQLAQKNNLPLVLHCRGTKDDPYTAYNEMLRILKSEILNLKSEISGVAHCFVGNLKQAQEFIKLGFYIGVNGIVTFKNASGLQSIIKKIPLDKILLETDCPFLAPDPYRGKRNEPAYIPIIAQKIAELKNIDLNEVEKQTTENAKKLFKLI